MKKLFLSLVIGLVLSGSIIFAEDIQTSTQTATLSDIFSQAFDNLKNTFTPVPKEAISRSPKWRKVRADFLKTHPVCAVCGSNKVLEVHHIIPFNIRPDLELVPDNLITLCESKKRGGLNCHLIIGHGGNYRDFNPDVVKDAKHFNELFFQWQTPKFNGGNIK